MRVVFGAGAVHSLPAEVDRLGLGRVLVLCGPEQAQTGWAIAEALGDRSVGLLAEARMHAPVELADRAGDRARELGADGCVAVGGGSGHRVGQGGRAGARLPVIAVPTTYAGSEMTLVWGLTRDGRKSTGRDARVLPRSVIYDSELTLTLPVGLSGTSGRTPFRTRWKRCTHRTPPRSSRCSPRREAGR